jgi:hypothetical protein
VFKTEARDDRIRIEMPKGSYIPKFHRTDSSPELAPVVVIPASSKLHMASPVHHLAAPIALVMLAVPAVGLELGLVVGNSFETVRPVTRQLRGLTHDWARCRRFPPDGKLRAYVSHRAADGKEDICLQQMSAGEIVRLTRMASNRH